MAITHWNGRNAPFAVSQIHDFTLGVTLHNDIGPEESEGPAYMPAYCRLLAFVATVDMQIEIPPGLHYPGTQPPPFSIDVAAKEIATFGKLTSSGESLEEMAWNGNVRVKNYGADGKLHYFASTAM